MCIALPLSTAKVKIQLVLLIFVLLKFTKLTYGLSIEQPKSALKGTKDVVSGVVDFDEVGTTATNAKLRKDNEPDYAP
tara:strand:- start:595 stop:828 length:234 start_codon:yes stop_codon:yes gene_type:complete